MAVGPGERLSTMSRPLLCQLDLLNFAGFVWMIRDAVNLQEIDAPGCVLRRRESYHAWPAAVSLIPQLVGSQGQASFWSAASCALKAEPSIGRLRTTLSRGMPRIM